MTFSCNASFFKKMSATVHSLMLRERKTIIVEIMESIYTGRRSYNRWWCVCVSSYRRYADWTTFVRFGPNAFFVIFMLHSKIRSVLFLWNPLKVSGPCNTLLTYIHMTQIRKIFWIFEHLYSTAIGKVYINRVILRVISLLPNREHWLTFPSQLSRHVKTPTAKKSCLWPFIS